MAILSISIPTYNRASLLESLIKSILSVDTEDIEVVVTDNCSTDNTQEMLETIHDNRLKVYKNCTPLPAYTNMIEGLFNAKSKYVMHCNDRELINIEQILPFIELLRNSDYSFIYTRPKHDELSFKVTEYKKGYDSLINNSSYTLHPSGMVFNRTLMGKYLNRMDYRKYNPVIYSWCFLQRDLIVYEKSALDDNGLWYTQPVKTYSKLKSGGVIFFDSSTQIRVMNSVIDQVIGSAHYNLTNEQEKGFILNVIEYFKRCLLWEKRYYGDPIECARYGVKFHYYGYFAMRRIYKNFIESCENMIERVGYTTQLRSEWDELSRAISRSLMKDCLRSDLSLAKMYICRLIHYNSSLNL